MRLLIWRWPMGLSVSGTPTRASTVIGNDKWEQSAANTKYVTAPLSHGPYSRTRVCWAAAAMFDYNFAATHAVSIAHLNELLPVRLPEDLGIFAWLIKLHIGTPNCFGFSAAYSY
jgi:hypothetical protein